ncbi:imelysin family protein [Salinivibrio proteolyticus]|uniref:imelysin family protein n=1 Tax=Salinivibrio proteolyticus TaxID=334715 RepID=UPI0009897999|nr:imelysin family protein [Salinivibrio proteolyticus]OOF32061.1 hypothetical protein BZJ20_02670 [Salinivibrio proteolyticus]
MRFRLNAVAVLSVSATLWLTGCLSQTETGPNHGLWHLQKQRSEHFKQTAAQLASTTAAVCDDRATVAEARAAWQTTMAAWMPLQGVEKGSEQALAQSWRIQFYPDKKNTTGRKINALLATDKTWQANDLAEQSVAVQGVGAMEWLLYDAQADMRDAKQCQLAKAVSGRLSQTASALNEAWQQNPWQGMPPSMAMVEKLGALNHQLDYVMKKLSNPLGKPGFPNPYQGEAWRSRHSLALLGESIKAMQAMYHADGGIEQALRERGYEKIADRVSEHWQLAYDSVPTDGVPLFERLNSVDGYRDMLTVYNNLEYLKLVLNGQVAQDLGIVVGFNATDGD